MLILEPGLGPEVSDSVDNKRLAGQGRKRQCGSYYLAAAFLMGAIDVYHFLRLKDLVILLNIQ